MELFTQKVATKLSKMSLGSGIRDPGSGINLFRIPDPGVKKHPIPDPGSGSATLVDFEQILKVVIFYNPPIDRLFI
jgi:hypothetical protein